MGTKCRLGTTGLYVIVSKDDSLEGLALCFPVNTADIAIVCILQVP